MAKKKKVKQNKQTIINDLYIELIGIGLLLLSVLMIGQLGLIGTFLKRVALFIFGEFFWLLALGMMVNGVRMMLTRKFPSLIKMRQIGFYLIFISLIIFSHIPVYREFEAHQTPLLSGMVNYYWVNDVLTSSFTVGGGLIGSILYGLFVPLITFIGLYMLALIILAYGTLLVFNMSIQDLYEGLKAHHQASSEKKATKISKSSTKVKEKRDRSSKKRLSQEADFEVEETIQPIFDCGVEVSAQSLEAMEEEIKQEEVEFKINDFIEQIQKQETEAPTLVENYVNELEYALPPLDLLTDHPQTNNSQRMLVSAKSQARKLEDTFKNFDVNAKVQEVHIGPAVTRFEILPSVGVKVSKIIGLTDDIALALAAKDIRIEAPIPGKSAVGIEVPNPIIGLTDDIALALAAKDIRIEAPIPGKSAVGIEVPNPKQTIVTFKEIVKEVPQKQQAEKLLMVLGRDISGKTVYSPLNKMPHLLVAGATGSGKSVCINAIICSILMRSTPNEVKMLMIDPKKVELNGYNGIPHLLAPVVTDPRLASLALKKVVTEMEYRYELFSESGTRNIESYNEYVRHYNETAELKKNSLPFVVVVIDELADLMMVASKEVEECIMRLTQMARAAGIHLIIATQRPSVDVITGVIKANIPSRIAFGVSSAVDSRTIIGGGY